MQEDGAARLEYCDWNAYSSISGTFTSQSDILEVAVTAVNNEGSERLVSHFTLMIVALSVKFLLQISMLN